LEKITLQRQAEHESFDKQVKEINEALLVLQEGRSILENKVLKASNAFIQTRQRFDSYAEKIEKADNQKTYVGRGYISLLRLASTVMEEAPANAGAISKAISIVQGIIDELERMKNLEYKAERERGGIVESVTKEYKANLEKLDQSIQQLAADIGTLQKRIDYSSARVRENEKAIKAKKQQETKEKKSCTEELANFKKQSKKR
jgi:flagellin-like hook-associated protein FlgL